MTEKRTLIHPAALFLAVISSISGWIRDERGDTNFISILIILGIVILLAGLFIGFKDQIIGQVEAIISGFTIG